MIQEQLKTADINLRIDQLAIAHPTMGYRRLTALLQQSGHEVSEDYVLKFMQDRGHWPKIHPGGLRDRLHNDVDTFRETIFVTRIDISNSSYKTGLVDFVVLNSFNGKTVYTYQRSDSNELLVFASNIWLRPAEVKEAVEWDQAISESGIENRKSE